MPHAGLDRRGGGKESIGYPRPTISLQGALVLGIHCVRVDQPPLHCSAIHVPVAFKFVVLGLLSASSSTLGVVLSLCAQPSRSAKEYCSLILACVVPCTQVFANTLGGKQLLHPIGSEF